MKGDAAAEAEIDTELCELIHLAAYGLGYGDGEVAFKDNAVEPEIYGTLGAGQRGRVRQEKGEDGDVFRMRSAGERVGPMGLGNEEAIDGRAGEERECCRVGGRPASGYESGGRSRG